MKTVVMRQRMYRWYFAPLLFRDGEEPASQMPSFFAFPNILELEI